MLKEAHVVTDGKERDGFVHKFLIQDPFDIKVTLG